MSAATSRLAGVLGDRLNPILVKEVRQALRGRYFRLLFVLTLTGASFVGLVMIADGAAGGWGGDMGPQFFAAMFGILAAAVHGFVPFSAFMSTSSEWEENTYDLLVLSNLSPLQLTLGKLYSSQIQALLFYSAFAPFLAFGFLMNGVDLYSVVVLLVGSMIVSSTFSLFSIALSSLTRARFLRMVIMALLAAALVMATGGTIAMSTFIVRRPGVLQEPEAQMVMAVMASVAAGIGLLATAVACARFAHEEENRSTPLRVVVATLGASALIWGWYLVRRFGDEEPAYILPILVLPAVMPVLLFILTERDTLGRRLGVHVPKNPLLALASIPFLPGGGRGVVFVMIYAVGSVLVTVWNLSTAPGSSIDQDDVYEGLRMTGIAFGFVLGYLALPSVAAGFVKTPRGRVMCRIGIPVGIVVLIFAPSLFGIVVDNRQWMELEHPLNPIIALDEVEGNVSELGRASLALVVLGSILAFLVNLPRMFAGAREVLVLSAARRRRERERRDGASDDPARPDRGEPTDALARP